MPKYLSFPLCCLIKGDLYLRTMIQKQHISNCTQWPIELNYAIFFLYQYKYHFGKMHISLFHEKTDTSCAGRCAAAPAGTTSAAPDCSTNHDSTDRISGQFLFYHDHNLQKVKGNLRFRLLVPLFVPIGVCMTTGPLVTSQLVCDITINRSRTTSATANLGFHSQSSLAM